MGNYSISTVQGKPPAPMVEELSRQEAAEAAAAATTRRPHLQQQQLQGPERVEDLEAGVARAKPDGCLADFLHPLP